MKNYTFKINGKNYDVQIDDETPAPPPPHLSVI